MNYHILTFVLQFYKIQNKKLTSIIKITGKNVLEATLIILLFKIILTRSVLFSSVAIVGSLHTHSQN